jgi:hypothetical protein
LKGYVPIRRAPTACQVFAQVRCLVVAGVLALAVVGARAANSTPVVGPGATKQEVIDAYGWPSGQSQSGAKEILTYPQGRITLESGKVEKMDFSPNVPWPAPKARPAPASPTSVKKAETPTDFWVTNFDVAQQEAVRRHARILALFIGSDWSPPSKQFQDEVALHADFVNAFTADFVFLRLDFPTRAPQPPEVREQNARLRAKYGVTTYPALLVLSPAGNVVAQVDLTKPQPGENYRARTIAAIRDVRDLLIASPPPPDPTPAAAAPAATEKPAPNPGSTSVSSAFPLILGAGCLGLVLAALAWWLLWRKREAEPGARDLSMAHRISDAAGGVPTPAEIDQWSKEKLCAIYAALVEADGYDVTWRGGGGDGDLALMRKGDDRPMIVVSLQAAAAGQVSAKRVKELFGTITVEDIPKGWFVAPKGFSKEAHDYAGQHPVVLIDVEDIVAQLRALPQLTLRKVLARVP